MVMEPLDEVQEDAFTSYHLLVAQAEHYKKARQPQFLEAKLPDLLETAEALAEHSQAVELANKLERGSAGFSKVKIDAQTGVLLIRLTKAITGFLLTEGRFGQARRLAEQSHAVAVWLEMWDSAFEQAMQVATLIGENKPNPSKLRKWINFVSNAARQLNRDAIGELSYLEGLFNNAKNDLAAARDHYIKALDFYKRSNSYVGMIFALREIGQLNIQEGDLASAISNLSIACRYAKEQRLKTLLGECEYYLGDAKFRAGDVESAHIHFDVAYQLALSKHDKPLEVLARLGLAKILESRGDLEAAYNQAYRALQLEDILDEVGDSGVAKYLNYLAKNLDPQ